MLHISEKEIIIKKIIYLISLTMTNTKNSVDINIGCKIKDARISAGMSGNDLAIKIGVSQQQVSRYESGQTPMTINTVIMIAHVLNVSVNELLSDYLSSEYSDIMLLMSNRNTEK